MKGHITTDGNLHIMRAGKYKAQNCPFVDEITACGDHCPLFGEPSGMGTMDLKLCHGKTINFSEFKDYRTLPKGA